MEVRLFVEGKLNVTVCQCHTSKLGAMSIIPEAKSQKLKVKNDS
jgi:hypothetical protein